MIGGLIDGLMGKVDFRAQGAKIDTRPGQQAIQTQARQGGQQALAQSYAMANSGRGGGGSQALALREAQRRGAEATANLNTQALAQQQALQQSANQQQAQAEMQAQQINSQIAMQEAGGMKQLVSAGLMAGALMSDYRQKEMISDFADKEPPGRFSGVDFQIPAYQTEPMVDPSMRPAPARGAMPPQTPTQAPAPQPQGPTLYERARTRADADPRPIAQYQPQQLREGVPQDALSNRAVAEHLRNRGEQLDLQQMRDPNEQAVQQIELEDRRQRAAEMMQPKGSAGQGMPYPGLAGDSTREGIFALGQELMNSDRRAKDIAFQQGMRAGMQRSPMVPGYTHVPPPGYGPMTSDFQQKEDLDPVRPTLYRYKPDSSYRQALEAANQTFQQAYEDKRAPREGIVAQDLQRSPAFAPSVVQKDDGQLAIDRDRALSAALFELGQMHQRVKRLEGGGRKRGA